MESSASVAAGWGTLARRPGRTARRSVVAVPLLGGGEGAGGSAGSDAARPAAGTLWLDDPQRHVEDAARLVEIALRAPGTAPTLLALSAGSWRSTRRSAPWPGCWPWTGFSR